MLFWRSAFVVWWLLYMVTGNTDTLNKLSFQVGDTIYIHFSTSCWAIPPYRTMFALNDRLALYFFRKFGDDTKTIIRIFDLGDGSPHHVNEIGRVKRPRHKGAMWGRKGRNPIGEAGITLAWRMVEMEVPFDVVRCNSRHYCDYLTYGTTFGSYLKLGYWPVSNDCPVHRTLTKDTDTKSPYFVIHDNRRSARTYVVRWDDRRDYVKTNR